MSKKLHLITQKIGDIQNALLRFGEGAEQYSMHVRMSIDKGPMLFCIINEDNDELLLNKQVSLIQKKNDDYLYISGHINDEVKTGCKVVSLRIGKACWFTRKRKGSAVFLQEKYIYQSEENKIELAS
ncbi:MAG: hypothetical protein ABIR30_07640 [Chitinophagaceae bacterium]